MDCIKLNYSLDGFVGPDKMWYCAQIFCGLDENGWWEMGTNEEGC